MQPKISVFIATSLDGFIARRDGSLDWLDHDSGGDDYGYKAFVGTVDTLVMGRHTYEFALTLDEWPYAELRVIVLSGTLKPADIPGRLNGLVKLSSSSPSELVAALGDAGARHIYVDGGMTIQSFMEAGLIQEMTLTVLPILLGDGISLFGRLDRDVRLELRASKAFDSGLVQTKYRVMAEA